MQYNVGSSIVDYVSNCWQAAEIGPRWEFAECEQAECALQYLSWVLHCLLYNAEQALALCEDTQLLEGRVDPYVQQYYS